MLVSLENSVELCLQCGQSLSLCLSVPVGPYKLTEHGGTWGVTPPHMSHLCEGRNMCMMNLQGASAHQCDANPRQTNSYHYTK